MNNNKKWKIRIIIIALSFFIVAGNFYGLAGEKKYATIPRFLGDSNSSFSDPLDESLGKSDSNLNKEDIDKPALGESTSNMINALAAFTASARKNYIPKMDFLSPNSVYIAYRSKIFDMYYYDMRGQNLAAFAWSPNSNGSGYFNRKLDCGGDRLLENLYGTNTSSSIWVDHLESFKIEPRLIENPALRIYPEDPNGNIPQPPDPQFSEAIRITSLIFYPDFKKTAGKVLWSEASTDRYYLPISREDTPLEDGKKAYTIVVADIMNDLLPAEYEYTGERGVFCITTQQYNTVERNVNTPRTSYIYINWESITAEIEIKGSSGANNQDPKEIILHSSNTLSEGNQASIKHEWILSGSALPTDISGRTQEQLNDALSILEPGSYTIQYIVKAKGNLNTVIIDTDEKDFVLTKPIIREIENLTIENIVSGNKSPWFTTDKSTIEYWSISEPANKIQLADMPMNSVKQHNNKFLYDTTYQLRPVNLSPGYKFLNLEISYDNQSTQTFIPNDGLVEFEFPSSVSSQSVTVSASYEKVSMNATLEALLLPLDANHISGQTVPVTIKQANNDTTIFNKQISPINIGSNSADQISNLLLNGEYVITVGESNDYSFNNIIFLDPVTKAPLDSSLQPQIQSGTTNVFTFTAKEEHENVLIQLSLTTNLSGELSLQFVTPQIDFGSIKVGDLNHVFNGENFTYTIADSRVTPGDWILSFSASPFILADTPKTPLPYTGLSFSKDGLSFQPVIPSTNITVEMGSTNTDNSNANKELHSKTMGANSGEGFSFMATNASAIAGNYETTITWTLTTAP